VTDDSRRATSTRSLPASRQHARTAEGVPVATGEWCYRERHS
jgi:hypothetical protein